MRTKLFLLLPLIVAFAASNAQSPAPIIVQPANAPAAPKSTTAAAATTAQSLPASIKQLEQIKAANDEVLAKQKAALQKLEELTDAADQLRIFSKRG